MQIPNRRRHMSRGRSSKCFPSHRSWTTELNCLSWSPSPANSIISQMCGLGPFGQKEQDVSDSETERNLGMGVGGTGDTQTAVLSRCCMSLGYSWGKLGARVDFYGECCKAKNFFDHFFLTLQWFSCLAGISVKHVKDAYEQNQPQRDGKRNKRTSDTACLFKAEWDPGEEGGFPG